jgi:photosystem II stability/assembly factor-like uncharacterized protein
MILGDDGTVVRTSNGGTSFVVSNPTTKVLYDVSMGSRNAAVITGHGIIMSTSNGGATWTTSTTPGSADVYSAHMVDATTGYAGTDWWGLWKTVDGGQNWSVLASHPSSGSIGRIDGFDANNLYTAYNNSIYRSTDGGATWVAYHNNPATISDLEAADNLTMVAGGYYGSWVAKLSSAAAGLAIPDYNTTANNKWAPSAEAMFGVCLQGVGGTAAAVAPYSDDPDTCTAVDTDPWQPITVSPVKLASATANAGSVDLVFGVRFPAGQGPGSYSAGVVFEALAPNA